MENPYAENESFGAGPLHSALALRRLPRDRLGYQWSRVHLSHDSVIPPPRSGAASVVVQGRLYVFGGYGGGTGRLDDFYSFDFRKSAWEGVKVVGDEKPGCRENNGVVISDTSKCIYLFGGYNGSAWLNDLWKFDIESCRWTCIQESSDNYGPEQATAAVGDHIGGMPGARSGVQGRAPSRRFGYVSVVHDNKLVLFGGFDGSRWLNDMYVFDFESKRWSEVQAKGTLPSVRSCPAWAKDDTHVYIQGGYDGFDRKDDFFACDLSTYTWTQMPSLGSTPSPRYFHSCCLYGNKMYLYGGYSGSQRLSDMYAYDFETNHWSPVDSSFGDMPGGRSSLVAQVHENNMYIFGGYNGSTVLNDFYKFKLKPIGVPPPALVGDLRRLLDNPEMADVSFTVEGREVHAHKAILATRSEYFRALLFNGHMRESQESNPSAPIPLMDVSYSVFLKVLEYIYTDNVQEVSLEDGIHLLIASEHFMLDRLKGLCEDIIRRDINVDTVIGILVASNQHDARGLKEMALEYILQNLTEPAIQAGLTELKTDPELLVEIIKLSSTQPVSPLPQLPRGGRMAVDDSSRPAPDLLTPRRSSSINPSLNGPFGTGAQWETRR